MSQAHSEVAPLKRVWLRHPSDAFQDQQTLDEQWAHLGYLGAPDYAKAVAEFDEFVQVVASGGAAVDFLPSSSNLSIDCIYVRDASIVTSNGIILCNMGKEERRGEPASHAAAAPGLNFPVLGKIDEPGRIEGGDFVWLRERVAAVGHGYRTNDEGIRQLRELLSGLVDELIVVPLPHWKGPGDVFHLMSVISPVDDDLAVVYSPLMPVPFRDRLLALGIELIEVPDEEFDSMGANVLATAPRRVVMLDGNPRTRSRLEAAGVDVTVYRGTEISAKGCGSPTCLTRPVARSTP